MIDFVFGVLYHLFYLVGATSIGFVLLRLGYPEVRSLPQSEKLFDSLLVGAGLYIVAFVVDVLLGFSLVPPNGLIPLTCFVLCAIAFFTFKFYSGVSHKNKMSVAIPTREFISNPKNAKKMKKIKQSVLTPVQPVKQVVARGGVLSGVKSFFDSKKSIAKGIISSAPKRELTEKERADYFANEVVPKPEMLSAPKRAGKVEKRRGGRRRLYSRGRANDSEEMTAFLNAVQKQFVKKGGVKSKKKKASGDDDFNLLVKDVYSDLKQPDKPQTGLGAVIPTDSKPKEATASTSSDSSITMNDLFGGPSPSTENASANTADANAAGGNNGDLFSQLSSISGGGESAKKEGHGSEFVDVKREQGMACPYCGAKNTNVVYCPYCSTGFCANCATSLVPGKDAFVYTCPKCGEDVTVKKS